MTQLSVIDTINHDLLSIQERFNSVLADKSISFEREAAFAVQIIMGSDYMQKIAMSNRQSVIDAVTNVAAIGISLNPANKQAYLVPRKNRICLDISYMGLMDLATATGSIRWAQAHLVHATDHFELTAIDRPPVHKFNPFGERGEVIGVFVVVKTNDGDYLTSTMDRKSVEAIRNRSEAWKAYLKDKSKLCPWNTDEGEMFKKTVVKQASKYWPKNDRLDQAIHHLNTEVEPLEEKLVETTAPATIEMPTSLTQAGSPPPPPPPSASGAATPGEKAFVKRKLSEAGIELDAALEQTGITDFENLTKDGFIKLRDFAMEKA